VADPHGEKKMRRRRRTYLFSTGKEEIPLNRGGKRAGFHRKPKSEPERRAYGAKKGGKKESNSYDHRAGGGKKKGKADKFLPWMEGCLFGSS